MANKVPEIPSNIFTIYSNMINSSVTVDTSIKKLFNDSYIQRKKNYYLKETVYKQLSSDEKDSLYNLLLFVENEYKGYELNVKNKRTESISFINDLLSNAVKKEVFITDIRQKNLNYALIAFGGLFSFGIVQKGPVSVSIAISLLLIIIAFFWSDNNYHRYIHGWRKTQKYIEKILSEIINESTNDTINST